MKWLKCSTPSRSEQSEKHQRYSPVPVILMVQCGKWVLRELHIPLSAVQHLSSGSQSIPSARCGTHNVTVNNIEKVRAPSPFFALSWLPHPIVREKKQSPSLGTEAPCKTPQSFLYTRNSWCWRRAWWNAPIEIICCLTQGEHCAGEWRTVAAQLTLLLLRERRCRGGGRGDILKIRCNSPRGWVELQCACFCGTSYHEGLKTHCPNGQIHSFFGKFLQDSTQQAVTFEKQQTNILCLTLLLTLKSLIGIFPSEH